MKLKTKIGLIVLGIIVLLGVTGGIYNLMSKKPTTTSNQTTLPKENLTKKLEPKLIWEKEFDGRIINLVVPKIPTIRKKDEFPIVAVQTENEIIFLDSKGTIIRKLSIDEYEKIQISEKGYILTKKEIIFFDSKGTVIRKVPIGVGEYEKIQISENGKYILKEEVVEEFVIDLKYMTQDGNILWEKKNIYGVPQLSPTGDTIVICGHEKGLQFYNKNGQIIKNYDLEWDFGSECLYFSPLGDYFVFGFTYWGNKREKSALLFFTQEGEMLWRYDVNNRYSDKILTSDTGEIIFFNVGCSIYAFNKEGKKLWEKDIGGGDFSLSPNGMFLLYNVQDTLFLVESWSGKKLWSLKLNEIKKYFFHDLYISNNGMICVILRDKKGKKSKEGEVEIIKEEKIYVISKEKGVIYKKRYINQEIGIIEFNEDNLSYFIKKDKHLIFYKLNF